MISQVEDVRRETAGKHRRYPGTWKQYSGRKSAALLSGKFLCFPAEYSYFSCRIIQDLASGIIDLGIYFDLFHPVPLYKYVLKTVIES